MHEKRIEIRWRDLDAYAHVNQAVYLTYVEETIDDWTTGALGIEGGVWDYVTARVAIDYRGELTMRDGAAVGSASVVHIGNTSVAAKVEIKAPDGRLAAEAEIVIVAVEGPDRTPRQVTRPERRALSG